MEDKRTQEPQKLFVKFLVFKIYIFYYEVSYVYSFQLTLTNRMLSCS